MSESVLDQDLVNELVEVMGEGFSKLVDSFREDSLNRLQILSDACKANDSEEIRLASHSFKGSSSNVGAQKVAKTCKQIEDLARDKQVEQAAQLLDRLQVELEESLQALEQVK